jgi:hypothetical protein
MAGEKSLWCLDCGADLWIGKNDGIFYRDAPTMEQLERFLLTHETTNEALHRLAYMSTSDVDAANIKMPLSADVMRLIDS